jgi:hypothetical protein
MLRFSAHYICLSFSRIFKNHYLEIDSLGIFVNCRPLRQETEAVSFHNGILFLSEEGKIRDTARLLLELRRLQQLHPASSAFEILELSGYLLRNDALPAEVFQIDGLNLSSPEFLCAGKHARIYIRQLRRQIKAAE